MFISQLFESNERRLVVVYPGRFQPFHQGHAEVFNKLQGKFGLENCWVVTTPEVKTDAKNPFNLVEKLTLMHAAGITDDRIAKVTQPYDITAITNAIHFDPKNTILIFAVGEPDKARLEVDKVYTEFTPTGRKTRIPDNKVVGDEKPFKTFNEFNECVTVSQGHAYVIVVKEVKKVITIKGQTVDVSHGTECRNTWNQIRNDKEARKEFLVQLYGRDSADLEHIFDKIPDSNAVAATPTKPVKLPPAARPAGGLDKNALIKEQQGATDHTWAIKDKDTGEMGIRPPGGFGTWTEPTLISSLLKDLNAVSVKVHANNATAAETMLYQKYSTIKAKLTALARYQEFIQKNGRRAIAPGREIDLGEGN